MTVNDVVAKVRELLEQGRTDEALASMARSGPKSPLIENACGVCQLRKGNYDRALPLFRELAFPRGSACMDHEVPAPFQTNFIVTMLLLGNIAEGLMMLKQIPDVQHPAVKRLREAVSQWTARQGTLKRILFALGMYGGTPFTMDSPGDLEG